MSSRVFGWPLWCVCAALACLGGCSSGNSGAHSPATPVGSAGPHPAAPADLDMVTAVSAGKGSLPLEVKFALRQRPEVGQSARLDLFVIPSASLDRVVTSVHAEEGLNLVDGGPATSEDRPEPGVPIARTVTIVAQHDGIFQIDATVLADLGSESIARTFTIPIIAGAGTQ